MNTSTARSILVVAAHPDDETLGCGATIAKHVASGDRVTVLIEKLWEDAQAANDILGVHKLIIRDLPDIKMNAIPMLDIVHLIEEVTREVAPSIVYTHHHGDVNTDHQTVSKAMQAVCRPMKKTTVNRAYAFEVPSATNWNFRHQEQFTPNVFIDVSETIEKKISAMERYRSEVRDFPHPRSRTYLSSLAKVRGGQVGYQAAEAFELIFLRTTNAN
jgi:LmbE family N-acetylglucosaminyl deacetylase